MKLSFQCCVILLGYYCNYAVGSVLVPTVASSFYTYSVSNDIEPDADSSYSVPTVNTSYFKDTANININSNNNGCTADRLVVYKVVLHTYWSRDLFPKHYPDWRPTAQWTRTIGRAHDSSFALFHLGQKASEGVKQFAETGKSDLLDNIQNPFPFPAKGAYESQKADRSVFDEFLLPSLSSGDGRSEAKFFVDSNHSLVSLMTRIVPSPDWFIGVDSLQLCVGGSWIDTVTVEMDPLDAGTDNGFTFTAPNWPTEPQGVIYRITSKYPAHPAGSFFYPKSKRLPPIATFQFIKLKEYELSEVFNFAEDDRKYEMVRTRTHLETEHNHVEMNNELSASIEKERQREATAAPTSITERDRIRARLLAKMNPLQKPVKAVVPKNDRDAIIRNIYESKKYKKVHGTRRSRDCRVSHWSEWGACSATCGIGEMQRHRKIVKHPKRGGRSCPPLQESKWCTAGYCYPPFANSNWSDKSDT